MKEIFVQFAREEMGHKSKLMGIKESGVFEIRNHKIEDLKKIADYLVDVEESPNMSYQEALVVAMKKKKKNQPLNCTPIWQQLPQTAK